MTVFCVILFWGCLGFLIPRKYMRIYMIVASVGVSLLYFFFQPPVAYDLFRHYELMHILRKHSLLSIMSGQANAENVFIAKYQEGSPLYLIYAHLISLFQADRFLPVITSIIIYTSVSSIILMAADDIGEDIAEWKIPFCFFFLLAMLDFRTISGIRNMMCYALFAHVLYKDLVRNSNKLLCFFAYVALLGVHSSVAILILVRLAIELYRFVPKMLLIIAALMAYSSIDVFISFASRFSDITIFRFLVQQMIKYGFGGGTTYILSRGAIRLFLTIVYLLIYLYCRKNIKQEAQFEKYGDFLMLYIMVSLGAIRQYDTFVRSNIFMYFMILPFLLLFLHDAVTDTPLQLSIYDSALPGLEEVTVYMLIYSAIALSLGMYIRSYYTPMDSGFSWNSIFF